MSVVLVKKVSTKCFDGAVKGAKKAFADGEARVSVGTIFGISHGLRIGVTQYGTFYALQGQFQATDNEGTEYIGTECFLPADYSTLVTAQMGELKGDSKEKTASRSVSFAFEIFVTPSSGDLGYAYQLSPMGEFTNPMDEIRKQLKLPNRAQMQLEINDAGTNATPDPNADAKPDADADAKTAKKGRK